MAGREQSDSFDDSITFRCWYSQKVDLEKIADKKGIDIASYIRGVLTKELQKNKVNKK